MPTSLAMAYGVGMNRAVLRAATFLGQGSVVLPVEEYSSAVVLGVGVNGAVLGAATLLGRSGVDAGEPESACRSAAAVGDAGMTSSVAGFAA